MIDLMGIFAKVFEIKIFLCILLTHLAILFLRLVITMKTSKRAKIVAILIFIFLGTNTNLKNYFFVSCILFLPLEGRKGPYSLFYMLEIGLVLLENILKFKYSCPKSIKII